MLKKCGAKVGQNFSALENRLALILSLLSNRGIIKLRYCGLIFKPLNFIIAVCD